MPPEQIGAELVKASPQLGLAVVFLLALFLLLREYTKLRREIQSTHC